MSGPLRIGSSHNKDNDDIEKESFQDFIVDKIRDMFVENIPVDAIRELQPRYMFFLGTISYMIMLCAFSYFFASGYTACRTRSFISISDADGECLNVPRPITGTYLLSTNGKWSGSSDLTVPFLYSEVVYYKVIRKFSIIFYLFIYLFHVPLF